MSKNKYEDWCYVCGEIVEEQKGIAVAVPSSKFHAKLPNQMKWGAVHIKCQEGLPQAIEEGRRKIEAEEKEYNEKYKKSN